MTQKHLRPPLLLSQLLNSRQEHAPLFCPLFLSTLLFSNYTLLYSTLLDSTSRYSTLLFSTLPLPSPLPRPLPYSTSTLPLLYLYSTLPLLYLYSTSTLPLLYFTQVPTGHNDLWASENVQTRFSEFPQ